MKNIQKFTARWHRAFTCLGLFLGVLTICQLTAGCDLPAWIQTANSIIPVLVTSAGSVLSLLAGLTGNAALASVVILLTGWGAKLQAGMQNIESLVSEYQSNPSDTLLENIEAAAQAVISDIPSFAQVEGIPASLSGVIQSFAQLILTQLEACTSLLPALKKSLAAGEKITLTVPMSNKAFKAQWNSVLAV